jgi:tRNA(adenine34) deaminase
MGPPGPQLQSQWMQLLLRHAERAGNQGEIPVAAVVLDEAGLCIGWGSNRREQQNDPWVRRLACAATGDLMAAPCW